jgi:positive regulator of sigma E activity
MTDVGIVKKIDGELVEVAFHEECQSCEKCGSCLATSKPRRFFAANSRGLALIPGDRVEYSISSGQAIRAAFMLLILPILLFFPFYYGASALLPGHGEAAPVVFGLAGVALGFAVNLLLRRGRRQYPEILRVVRP